MEQPTHGACSRPSRQLPHLPPTPSNSRRWETAAGQSPPNQQYQTPAPSDAEAWVFEGRMCHTATSLVSASAGPVAEGAEGGYVEGGATEGELGPVDNKRKHGRKLRQQQERQEALLLLQQQQQGKEQLEGVEGQQGGKKPKVRASKVGGCGGHFGGLSLAYIVITVFPHIKHMGHNVMPCKALQGAMKTSIKVKVRHSTLQPLWWRREGCNERERVPCCFGPEASELVARTHMVIETKQGMPVGSKS
eukprot:scaffold43651_cov18-Tisochrysis_lutea.AAC.1